MLISLGFEESPVNLFEEVIVRLNVVENGRVWFCGGSSNASFRQFLGLLQQPRSIWRQLVSPTRREGRYMEDRSICGKLRRKVLNELCS
jgi:hypothetical protein